MRFNFDHVRRFKIPRLLVRITSKISLLALKNMSIYSRSIPIDDLPIPGAGGASGTTIKL